MPWTTVLSLFFLIWSALFLLDYYLRSINFEPYVKFAARHGLSISPLHLRFYTSRIDYSDPANRLPSPSSLLSRVWFTLGAVCAIVCFCGISAFLTKLLVRDLYRYAWPQVPGSYSPAPVQSSPAHSAHFRHHEHPPQSPDVSANTRGEEAGLTPVIPGFNVPWSHVPLFFAVLIISGIYHELGHAWAAKGVGARVNGFGIFIVGLYPGAFTDIDTQTLHGVSAWRKTRVFGAGIWHNVILAGMGYALLMHAPSILHPFYAHNQGVLVTSVDSTSSLSGEAGLKPGDILRAVNHCQVRTEEDWHSCVSSLHTIDAGYCVSTELVERFRAMKVDRRADEMGCCDEFANTTRSHLCFEFESHIDEKGDLSKNASSVDAVPPEGKPVMGVTPARSLHEVLNISLSRLGVKAGEMKRLRREILQKKPEAVDERTRSTETQFSCLPARYVTDLRLCNITIPCALPEQVFLFFSALSLQKSFIDPVSHRELPSPSVEVCVHPALYNGTRLLRIHVENSSRPVLFIGLLDELSLVTVSGWTPRHWLMGAWLPSSIDLIGRYTFTLSLGMALLNAVPCYGLDGQYLAAAIVNLLRVHTPKRRKKHMVTAMVWYGTTLLVGNVLLGFLKFFHVLPL